MHIYLDSADLSVMRSWSADPRVVGFTTNPSLARAAGHHGAYLEFAREALHIAEGRPVSVEVISDDLDEMVRQGLVLAELGDNVLVKVPIRNSAGESTGRVISALSASGVGLNVTAVFTRDQAVSAGEALGLGSAPAVVSVFAGRISDAGVEPLSHLTQCRWDLQRCCARAQMLWASARQVYDVKLATRAGCAIITLPPALLKKLDLDGKDLEEYSRETAAEFARDARAAGFEL